MPTIAEALALGWKHHQAGELQRAEQVYRQVLQAAPQTRDAWYLLGCVGLRLGKATEAVANLEMALRLDPDFAEAQNNLGVALAALQRHDAAQAAFEKTLEIRPDYAEAHNNLGRALRQHGRFEDAVASFHRAIERKPAYAEAHMNLGVALLSLGRQAAAMESLHEAVRLGPGNADAHYQLGLGLAEQEKLAEAALCFRQVLTLRPSDADAANGLGVALARLGQRVEAIACFQQALRLRPDLVEAHNSLGVALSELDRLEEALHCFDRALQLQPNYAEAHNNRGNALRKQGRYQEAIVNLRQALHCKADYPEAHNNLGVTLAEQGHVQEALEHYDQALRLRPDYSDTHKNRALALLVMGDFEQGLAEYEWRWRCKDSTPRSFQQPLWQGDSLDGKTILLHAEQGVGDILQFVRYTALVKARGATVLLECPASLTRLLATCPGIDRCVARGTQLPDFDVHAPLLSLLGIFGTTVATIPACIPYLFAEEGLVHSWQQQLQDLDGFRIGIVWQGNPRFANDRRRSIPLAQFAPLARQPGVRLVSLQKGPGREQIQAVADQFSVTDLADKLDMASDAFVDTAAVMKSLDLVISSDTAAGHLAGALGVPVWLALSFVADWRWLQQRRDTPWYPTMRLFRQRQPDNWQSVLRRMAKEVEIMTASDIESPARRDTGTR